MLCSAIWGSRLLQESTTNLAAALQGSPEPPLSRQGAARPPAAPTQAAELSAPAHHLSLLLSSFPCSEAGKGDVQEDGQGGSEWAVEHQDVERKQTVKLAFPLGISLGFTSFYLPWKEPGCTHVPSRD